MPSPSPMLLRALRGVIYSRAAPRASLHCGPQSSTISYRVHQASIRASSSLPSSHSPKTPAPSAQSSANASTSAPAPTPASEGAGVADSSPLARKGSARGPPSEETTQTDFAALNVLGGSTPPSAAIDACWPDGFALDNGIDIGGGSGLLLVQGEAFRWRPWTRAADGSTSKGLPPPQAMLNAKGQWEVSPEAWGVLDCVWPKPELLVLGLGASVYPLAPATKHHLNALGIQVDIQDTRNAAAQFNLLATERGVRTIAAALIPVGWKGRR